MFCLFIVDIACCLLLSNANCCLFINCCWCCPCICCCSKIGSLLLLFCYCSCRYCCCCCTLLLLFILLYLIICKTGNCFRAGISSSILNVSGSRGYFSDVLTLACWYKQTDRQSLLDLDNEILKQNETYPSPAMLIVDKRPLAALKKILTRKWV